MISINLTIHNKQDILLDVLNGIFNNTISKFEFIAVLDGCTDNSEKIVLDFLQNNKNKNLVHFNVLYADNVFETKANNIAAKASNGRYIVIVQDDCVITEYGWDERILRPFKYYRDVFAVSGNCAHNWKFNENRKDDLHFFPAEPKDWCDILIHHDHANKTTCSKDIFAIRQSVNRGPLAIDRFDLIKLGYFDEEFAPLENDDHDLMYRARYSLGKVCGYYGIDFVSKPEWGGTRNEQGQTKQWVYAANHKNARLLYHRHSDKMKTAIIENRNLS